MKKSGKILERKMTKIRKRKISSIFEKQPSTGFLRKKPEVVEIFLSEKLSCVPIKEVPSRSSKKYVMYDSPIREEWYIDNKKVLEVSLTHIENNISWKFVAFNERDREMLKEIIIETYEERKKP